MMDNILICDIESGGLSPTENGLCSVTLKVLGKDIIKTIIIQPEMGVEYHPKAFAVNGFTLERLKDLGLPVSQVTYEINKFISDNFNGIKPFVLGHNINFDIGFLDAFYKRNGGEKFSSRVNYHFMDTMMFAQLLHHADIKKHSKFKLTVVYKELFGEDFADAHTSSADVLATEKVFQKQVAILKGMKELALKNLQVKNNE